MEPSPDRQSRPARFGPLKGPGLSLLLAVMFWQLPGYIHPDVFAAALGLNTAYAAFSGGVWSALTTMLLSLGYLVQCYFDPAEPFGFSPDERIQLMTMAFAFPASILLVLWGKSRAELAAKLQTERDAALAHARKLETEVERRLAELRQASAQQDELERFRELDRLKGLFVGSVSHELRTPLTSIIGYTEFLEDGIGGPLSPVQHDYLQQIHRSSRQLQHLVDDLLDFARLEAGTFKLNVQPIDLVEKTQQVANSLRPQVLEAKQQLVVDLPEGPMCCIVDSQRIEQVMLNLLSNAIKFTPEGGSIRIVLTTEGEMARWSVQDSGIGIDPVQLEKLFLPYSRIDTGHGVSGTGLGLCISRSLVEAHGGEIGVESLPGVGSIFWFRLPMPSLAKTGGPVESDQAALGSSHASLHREAWSSEGSSVIPPALDLTANGIQALPGVRVRQ